MSTLGCRAQVPAAGSGMSPDLTRRVELLIRQRTKIPPDYVMSVGDRTPSEIPGFDKISVIISQENAAPSRPIMFLLSKDNKTLAQFNQYDISKDPKTIISGAGRPMRGSEKAPVDIVVFDDLECPYCARMHAQLFPALLDRYGDKVRVEYKDYPLSQHPWAMRAAVDANCLGDLTTPGYWNMVDYVHAHAAEIGGTEKTVEKANADLDKLALDEAMKAKVNAATLNECIKKQNTDAIKASIKVGDELGVEATPVLFINGEKLEGAYPVVDVFRMVDEALVAEGISAPPPYKPVPEQPTPLLKPAN